MQAAKKSICSVAGLMIPKEDFNDEILDYIELFIDQVPILTEQMKKYISDGRAVAFAMSMRTISAILNEIHAKWLTVEANRITKLAETGDLINCKKRLTPFITDLLSLSIDLQIAQENTGILKKQSTIELYTEALNNLNAVDTLISDKDYDKAYSIVSRIELLRENKNARRLLKFLDDKDHRSADNAVKALKDEYTELLYDLGVILGEDHTKKKLLTVDDNSDILITVKGMLEQHFNVYAAAGGKTALAIMEKHKPDIFLLDIEMPEISGFELAKTIRATDGHRTTPIIFLTSNATRGYVIKALRCGGNDFIVKPASYNSLMVKISNLIDFETR